MANNFSDNELKCIVKHNFKCKICGNYTRIIHHKNCNHQDDRLNNLILLCRGCHNAFHSKLKDSNEYCSKVLLHYKNNKSKIWVKNQIKKNKNPLYYTKKKSWIKYQNNRTDKNPLLKRFRKFKIKNKKNNNQNGG